MFSFFILLILSSFSSFASSCISNCVCNGQEITCDGGDSLSAIKAGIISAGLQNSVETLKVLYAQDTVLPANYLNGLTRLIEFTVRYGELKIIEFGAFNNASSLQEIDLRDNSLTWLSGEMFTGLTTNMKRLRIDNNNIKQILSNMEGVFSLVSTQISMGGNNLQCSCQLQWLSNWLKSGVATIVTGASCSYNGSQYSLVLPDFNFTDYCIDLCSLDYVCPINSTCVTDADNGYYVCLNDDITPSPSPSLFSSPSPSLFPSPSPSMFESSFFSLPISPSAIMSTATDTIAPSPTTTPTICHSACDTKQYCLSYCNCSICQCYPQYIYFSNNNCLQLAFNPSLYCSSTNQFGLLWPQTAINVTITLPCCSLNNQCGSGTIRRTCLTNAQWSQPILDSGCVSLEALNLQALLTNAKGGDPTALNELSKQIMDIVQSGSITSGDITLLTGMISQMVQLVNQNTSIDTLQSIVESISGLLADSNLESWQQLESSSQTIANLFSSVEQLGYTLPLHNSTLILSTDNLALIVLTPTQFNITWNFSSKLLTNYSGEESSIHLPASIFTDIFSIYNLSDCNARLVVSLWDVDSSLLQVNRTVDLAPLVHGQCDWGANNSMASDVYFVNSIVISASVHSSNCTVNMTRFNDPVRITLYHVNTSLENPSCSFLNQEDMSGTDWLSEGCSINSDSTTHYTICECYHFTSFALLMSPTGTTTTSQPLLIATKVGLSISIAALIVTIIILFALKTESKLNVVHRQLALSLCLSQTVFLIGVDRSAVPSPDWLCTLIAGLLHYLLLCTFAWELVEGVHLYLFIVRVFYNEKIVWLYYPLAWGIPLIIVGITMGINFCDYGSINYCWISGTSGTIWAFHVPVIVVFIINLIVLVVVSIVVARASRKKHPERCALCSLLQASFILVPTLGLTWVLGFLVVGNDTFSAIIDWLFLICTTLQGITLFIIHCVINTEVHPINSLITAISHQIRTAFFRAIGCREMASKQKPIFEWKPAETLNSMASYTRRRLSLGGSRRGSSEQPSMANTNQESAAYKFAQAFYNVEENSIEDSQFKNSIFEEEDLTSYRRQSIPLMQLKEECLATIEEESTDGSSLAAVESDIPLLAVTGNDPVRGESVKQSKESIHESLDRVVEGANSNDAEDSNIGLNEQENEEVVDNDIDELKDGTLQEDDVTVIEGLEPIDTSKQEISLEETLAVLVGNNEVEHLESPSNPTDISEDFIATEDDTVHRKSESSNGSYENEIVDKLQTIEDTITDLNEEMQKIEDNLNEAKEDVTPIATSNYDQDKELTDNDSCSEASSTKLNQYNLEDVEESSSSVYVVDSQTTLIS